MEQVTFAVVGCGNIGKRHLAVLAAEPGAGIAGVCDIDEAVCRGYAEQYGTPGYADYREMLAETPAEVISICTPHGWHHQMAVEAARAGKHILVEKPMALTIRDAHSMIELARQYGVKLMVVKQNRYNIPIMLTKKALDENRLGRIFMVEGNVLWNRHEGYYTDSPWRGRKALEGGALFTQVSHFIDLMIWWFGDVVKAAATIGTKNHAIDIEDCGLAHVLFESGVMGNLIWTTCVYQQNYEGSITIVGEFGTIKIGGQYLNQIEFWNVKDYPLPPNITFSDQPNAYGKYQGTSSNHDKVIADVVREVRGQRCNIVEGGEGIKTIEAIEMIYDNATLVMDNVNLWAVQAAQAGSWGLPSGRA